jgi:histidinol phosphatase-like enzyme (inositol monophosphatase family)
MAQLLAELEDFALELAHTAGSIARAHFRQPITIENKGGSVFDPVTNADRGIERVLRSAIVERFPDHGIVAEEEGERAGRGEFTWYIDPIDGTRAFMTGSPLWGTLIGLTRGVEPLFGVLVQPVLEEVFFGAPNGSWLIKPEGRVRLRARACTTLDRAVLACTHPDMFAGPSADAFKTLAARCLLHRFGGDCYNYAMLAAGFIDLVVEGQLKPFDIVPLLPVLEGAGCVVTDWQGGKPLKGGYVVAAATRELHAAALKILQSAGV